MQIALPGSLWPLDAGAEPTANVKAPHWQQAISGGVVARIDAACWSGWLMHALTGSAVDAPFAALAGADRLDGEGTWLRADPAYFEVGREDVALATPTTFDVTDDEAVAFVNALNEHFAPDRISFHVVSAKQWRMHVPSTLDVVTTDPWAAMNVPARYLAQQGADAQRLRKIAVEAQMILFAHPLNEVRQARGIAPVNALWLWASGQTPPKIPTAQLSLVTSCQQARRLGEALNLETQYVSATSPASTREPQHALVAYLPVLMSSFLNGDGQMWRETAASVVDPMLKSLLSPDAPPHVQIILGGQRPTHCVTVRHASGLSKWWRALTGGGDDLGLALHAIAKHDA